MLLANISRELVESGISCTSIIHITLSTLNQCTMHKLFFLFLTARNRKKNYWVIIIIIIIITEEYLCHLPSAVFRALLLVSPSLFSRSNPSWLMTFINNEYKPLTKLVETLLKSLSDVLNVWIVDYKRPKWSFPHPAPPSSNCSTVWAINSETLVGEEGEGCGLFGLK